MLRTSSNSNDLGILAYMLSNEKASQPKHSIV